MPPKTRTARGITQTNLERIRDITPCKGGIGPPDYVPLEFDCAMRQLGVEYAQWLTSRYGVTGAYIYVCMCG
jgi:hypothetical protein